MKTIIGVMGPGEEASETDISAAGQIGTAVAKNGWVILTGGRKAGVMDAASAGAREAGGLTVGILPGRDKSGISNHLDIAIPTGMGEARNVLNILTADVIIAIGMNPGTASEIALAVKAGKPVILLNCPPEGETFFTALGGDLIHSSSSAAEAIRILHSLT